MNSVGVHFWEYMHVDQRGVFVFVVCICFNYVTSIKT